MQTQAVRSSKLEAQKQYVARIWHGNGKYAYKNVMFLESNMQAKLLKEMQEGTQFNFLDIDENKQLTLRSIGSSLMLQNDTTNGKALRVTFSAAAVQQQAKIVQAIATQLTVQAHVAAPAGVLLLTYDGAAAQHACVIQAQQTLLSRLQHIVLNTQSEVSTNEVAETKEEIKRRKDRERKAAKRAALKAAAE
jgi:hypothetical protein